uniref:Large ribosomal subunit protein uL2c n=1 Tax=Pedobesia claviformis TaxID=2364088 RepID=A0A386B0R8_9CHLO|nr:ribosomal protein L2 [Pedobesia claviformis]AYC65291.1 ribosomal protein L2 [Pedobesia claviformis]
MCIRVLKPYTPSTRNRSVCDFQFFNKTQSRRNLTSKLNRSNGCNHRGVKTIKNRGGGHKRLYRIMDWKRKQYLMSAKVISLVYDPNRNSNIALINYTNNNKAYIIQYKNIKIGDLITTHFTAPIRNGNTLPLKQIPIGIPIHNIEIHAGKGAQLVRAAGTAAFIIAKEMPFVTIRLPSGEIRNFLNHCWATIGSIHNASYSQLKIGKAGRNRWLNKRPKVRGTVKNAADHPHGGGEGRAPIGRKHPVTPWGKPTLGFKTRKKSKYSELLIVTKRR